MEAPSSPQRLRREQRELRCVSFWVTFCADFDEQSTILGARGGLAPVWGRVPKAASKKHASATKPPTILGALFRAFRDFLPLDFLLIFEVTSESELSALWRRKGTQKQVFGEPFRSDSEVSGESENEAPVQTSAPF